MKDITCVSAKIETEQEPINCKKIVETFEGIRRKHDLQLLSTFAGLKVMPDPTGMMVGEDDYMLVVGHKLYDRLKNLSNEKATYE